MRKKIISAGLAGLGLFAFALPALAQQPLVDSFVCPVITTENVLHSPNSMPIGEGHYTIGGPDIMVPEHATNADGDGTPPGPHSEPGDTDYTAVWERQ